MAETSLITGLILHLCYVAKRKNRFLVLLLLCVEREERLCLSLRESQWDGCHFSCGSHPRL
jgi:hypothetical protein